MFAKLTPKANLINNYVNIAVKNTHTNWKYRKNCTKTFALFIKLANQNQHFLWIKAIQNILYIHKICVYKKRKKVLVKMLMKLTARLVNGKWRLQSRLNAVEHVGVRASRRCQYLFWKKVIIIAKKNNHSCERK